jgi:integrase
VLLREAGRSGLSNPVPWYTWYAVARATRLAGFGKHGPQVLRRSYCTWMAQSGTPAAEAAAQTGHSIQVWEEDYVKPLLNGTRGQEIMRRMEAM